MTVISRVFNFGFFALLLLALQLAGCREHEQGRPLRYEKGTYLGKADSRLADDTVSQLQMRTMNQRGP